MLSSLEDATLLNLPLLIDQNLNAFLDLIQDIEGIETHTDSHLRYSLSHTMPYAIFNMVLAANLELPRQEGVIHELIRRYESQHLPLVWQVGPSSTPPDLGHYLARQGLNIEGASPGMALDLAKLGDLPAN